MCRLEKKQQVLRILADNLNTPNPELVASDYIADKLDMSKTDTCQLLKLMHEMGVVVSDMEGERSLITHEGLSCLQ
ncbi:hypothetical protein [Desulforhopalus singaporensis]|uniref:Uncharacterized protein n=1 Tax=Desulforhopalus singaporensis TaxID=91360 RepID=A0A1H0LVW0_9BACT|nr:hypothetical protein [Desulforhopalus singaporensis]SDO72233.1 hypothetical protein SAMN05660330_00874 [Desulforhopalus singaporensis]